MGRKAHPSLPAVPVRDAPERADKQWTAATPETTGRWREVKTCEQETLSSPWVPVPLPSWLLLTWRVRRGRNKSGGQLWGPGWKKLRKKKEKSTPNRVETGPGLASSCKGH
ncbi:hypothetical protein MRX96_007532 [Rhipicephalus microplus]